MNYGAFVFQEALFDSHEIDEIAGYVRKYEQDKINVHAEGRYAKLKWFQVELSKDLAFCKKVLSALHAEDPELLVFYYLEPGAKIPPHRDLTGASLNNRLRFHVPVITNPGIIFKVSDEMIRMRPGDLWCLDTSYKHSVENSGAETRTHIVIECTINDYIKSRIPKNFKTRLHSLMYLTILVSSLAKALAVNSIKDRSYFKDQMKMVLKFFKWRVLRMEKPK